MEAKIELRHMRSFLAIAEELNFRRAARRSHITQSALSKQMKTVENELGTRVFERHTKQIVLTKAGRIFKREAAQAIEHSRRGISLVHALCRTKEGPIRIGVSALCDRDRLHLLLAKAEYEAVSATEIHAGHTAGLVQSVARGQLDAAIVDVPIKTPGLRVLPLYSEPLIAVLPEKNPFRRKPALALQDIHLKPITLLSLNADPGRLTMERYLRTSGSTVFKIREVSHLTELLDQVALEGRLALVRASTQRLTRVGIAYKVLSDSPMLDCALIWRTDNRHRPLHSLLNAVYAASQKDTPKAPA